MNSSYTIKKILKKELVNSIKRGDSFTFNEIYKHNIESIDLIRVEDCYPLLKNNHFELLKYILDIKNGFYFKILDYADKNNLSEAIIFLNQYKYVPKQKKSFYSIRYKNIKKQELIIKQLCQ